jgi:DNA invertase Pin-like site-specific DNA recombinase
MPATNAPAGEVLPLRAAEYVRMSTDRQIYSPLNQQAAIRIFAATHGMEVVRTYLDEGRSGLNLVGRPALQALLADVEAGQTGFSVVLVYDVSRWGRFQNQDEAAYCEFLCLRAGVRVHYVAEPFDNDGSPLAAILKNLKRTMAAEYSRELSIRVTAGQVRLAHMGFHVGALAGYGLRRMLVDANGRQKGLLAIGERKSLLTDRVVLVPGPKSETDTVKRMFRESGKGRTIYQIADGLNADGLRNHRGTPWRYDAVRRLLLNEKYVGHIVYGKTRKRLRSKQVSVPPEAWIRHDHAFEGLVTEAEFRAVTHARAPRALNKTDEELLAPLRRLLKKHGRLSIPLIDAEPDLFCARIYGERFGGFRGLYARLGYKPPKNLGYADARIRSRRWLQSIIGFCTDLLEEDGSSVERSGQTLVVDHAWTVMFEAVPDSFRYDRHTWYVRDRARDADMVVFARMSEDGAMPLDYVILPRVLFPHWPPALRETLGPALESMTFASLAVIGDMARLSHLARCPCI